MDRLDSTLLVLSRAMVARDRRLYRELGSLVDEEMSRLALIGSTGCEMEDWIGSAACCTWDAMRRRWCEAERVSDER